jgi:SAM-dependent methyltransferase
MPPTIALMHLIGATANEAAFAQTVQQARANTAPAIVYLCALADRNPDCWRLAHDVLATVDHDGATSVEKIAAMFDDAVALSPAASVALYTLGDEAALELATQEVVGMIRDAGLLKPDSDVLDLGCGIGRFVRALSPHVRHVIGLDISRKMIDEARRRCADLTHVRLDVSSGRDLAGVDDTSVDLILAADVFPYLVQVELDLAGAHLREAARVLRPGGALLILNFSYRGDPARDAADLRELARIAGLVEEEFAAAPLAHWDAARFLLRRPS